LHSVGEHPDGDYGRRDNYLAMTLELLRRAEKETDPEKRKALETLAE
jgi:hypothetical protein